MKRLLKAAFLATLPVMAGYLVLGMGFGVLLTSKGYGPLWAIAMSTFIYAGSMQYLAVDLLTGGASLIAAALTALLVNARHLFYGISMIDRYRDTGAVKPYLIFGLTDETYSLVCDGGSRPTRYYALVTLLDHLYWVGGTALGALLGSVVPIPTEGIDFALTALFVTIAVEQWKARGGRLPAVIGLAASVVCLLVFGPAHFLIPAMLLITAALLLLRRVRREEGDGHAWQLWMVVIIAAVTAALRFLPFWLFGGKRRTPAVITYLGKMLPYAIMTMLVVYCLRNVQIAAAPFGIPELLCCGLVVLLHWWKGNTLLSILGGTVVYMLLVQTVF